MRGDFFYPPRNFGAIPPEAALLEKAKVVIIPVPYDSTVEWRSGARDGPQAIIDASQYLEMYDPELGCEIDQVGICTLPEVIPWLGQPEQTIHRVYQVAVDLLQEEKFLVLLGGEHSLSLGMVKALKEKHQNLSVLQLDAHADLRDEYLGTRYSHACVMRRILEFCPIAQAGLRSLSLEEQEFLTKQGIAAMYASDFNLAFFKDKLLPALSSEVYITIDLDVFDPSIMAAVGTPEPGGLSWYQVLELLRMVAQHKKILGFDLVELCPKEGPTACAFLAAKLAYKLMGYAFKLTG